MKATIALALMSASVFADGVIYRNDFSTRESAQPIPAYGVVHEAQPYSTNAFSCLCFTPDKYSGYPNSDENAERFTWRSTYYAQSVGEDNDRPSYDGWVTPFHKLMSSSQYKAYPTIRNDDGNPVFAWWSRDLSDRQGFAIQSIHNTFTSGVLRIQVDMHPPKRWTAFNGTLFSCRVFPVCGRYMDPAVWQGGDRMSSMPGSFGVTSGTSSSHEPERVYLRSYYVDATPKVTNRNFGNSYLSTKAIGQCWVRFVMSYDLDNAKHSGAAYHFAADVSHPTFDTEPSATAYGSYENFDFPAMDEVDGGVAGIGLMCRGAFGDQSTTTNKVLIDNLRISWKAAAAADFEVFYENDFSNRWYRTLCASARSTSSSAYAPVTMRTNLVDSSSVNLYAQTTPSQNSFATNSYLPAVSASPSAVQPVGYDGWRRLPIADDASAMFAAFNAGKSQYDRLGTDDSSYIYGDGLNWASFSSHSSASRCALIAHPIGETYTSGRVRLSVDMRLPLLTEPVTYVADMMRAAIGLGSTALYSSARAELAANLVAGCGYVRTLNGTVTNHVPYVMAHSSSATQEYALETSFTEPQTEYWHRMEVAVDLDARTYGVTVTPLSSISIGGDFAPTNAPIYAKTGLPLASDAEDIGTIYLRGFGYRESMSLQWMKGRICFDNIRVWRQATGSETETLTYLNDFETRTRTSTGNPTSYDRAVGYVADIYDLDDGPDHWIRRSVAGDQGYWATATVRNDGGNQFLALGRELESGRRVQVSHAFGQSVSRPFRFAIDIRPPSGWRTCCGFATVSLGDAQMGQTEVAESIFNVHRQMAFGFSDTTVSPECPWFRPAMQPVAYTVENGVEVKVPICAASEISNDHWYRFKATVRPQEGRYDMRLYDMGTAHPSLSSTPGSLVGVVNDLRFLNDPAPGDGIGVFNIHAYGMGGVLGEAGVDGANVLIDNIVAVKVPAMAVTVR